MRVCTLKQLYYDLNKKKKNRLGDELFTQPSKFFPLPFFLGLRPPLYGGFEVDGGLSYLGSPSNTCWIFLTIVGFFGVWSYCRLRVAFSLHAFSSLARRPCPGNDVGFLSPLMRFRVR